MTNVDTVLKKLIKHTEDCRIKWREVETGFEANINGITVIFDSATLFGMFELRISAPCRWERVIEQRESIKLMGELFFAIDEQVTSEDCLPVLEEALDKLESREQANN